MVGGEDYSATRAFVLAKILTSNRPAVLHGFRMRSVNTATLLEDFRGSYYIAVVICGNDRLDGGKIADAEAGLTVIYFWSHYWIQAKTADDADYRQWEQGSC